MKKAVLLSLSFISAISASMAQPGGSGLINDRFVIEQSCMTVNTPVIKVELWDAGVEDNDTVTLYLNGQPILEKYRLTKTVRSFEFRVNPGRNQMVLYAENLGDLPDNTAAFTVNGSKRQSLNSGLKVCGSMNINFNAMETSVTPVLCNEQRENEDAEARAIKNNPALNTAGGNILYTGIRRLEGEPYRTVKPQGCYNVTQDEIDLILWDCGVEDNDTISLFLNGKWILENYRLTKAKKSFRVKLEKGENYIVMYAHNLGDIPNNTAALGVSQQFGSADAGTMMSDANTCAAFRLINGISPSGLSSPCVEKNQIDSTSEPEMVYLRNLNVTKNKNTTSPANQYQNASGNYNRAGKNPGYTPVYVPTTGGSGNGRKTPAPTPAPKPTPKPAPKKQPEANKPHTPPSTPTQNKPKTVEH